eukprot:17736-Heterococcus_DN1.PRE.1
MNVDQSRKINKPSINTTVKSLAAHLKLAQRCCGIANEVANCAERKIKHSVLKLIESVPPLRFAAAPKRVMRFRPCIDLHAGKVKQIVGSTLSATGASTADLEAALAALQEYPGGMHLGGGVTPATAKKYLDAGASHVIVTSYVFQNGQIVWERLKELVAAVGKERLVLDLSCRR